MRNRISPYILGLVLLFSLAGTVASSQQVILSSKVGECELTVESDDEWHTLRLRAHHPEYKGCNIDRDLMLSALDAALAKAGSQRPEESYASLYIGRLIDYPWLSRYLATAAYRDHRWNSKKGKPVSADINKYVSDLLSSKDLLSEIETVFARGGYRVKGVTVEKVLVGGFRDVPLYQGKMPPGRVPFDAQVWFILEKK